MVVEETGISFSDPKFVLGDNSFPIEINAGSSRNLSVKFVPGPSGSGVVSGQIQIDSNSFVNPTISLNLKGTI